MDEFKTPPDHIGFRAKKVFGAEGRIVDGAIAYLEPDGGGPVTPHTHPHNHLFTVISGEARVELNGETHIIHENESLLVPGSTLHSVWNNSIGTTVMLGISIQPE